MWLHGFHGFCFPDNHFYCHCCSEFYIGTKTDADICIGSARFYKIWHFWHIQMMVMLPMEAVAAVNCGRMLLPALWRPCDDVWFLEDQLPPGFPTIDMGPQLKVVERSRTATMLCAASGNPDPEITWFKDFLPVNTSNNNGRIKQLRSGNRPLSPALTAQFYLSPLPLCF